MTLRQQTDIPILSGDAIIEAALPLVGTEALHYREWFNRLHRAGYAVAGKDPLAVMCSNLNRHPLIKRTGNGDGVYQCDEDALDRLRDSVAELRQRVVALIETPDARDAVISDLQAAERILARHGEDVD